MAGIDKEQAEKMIKQQEGKQQNKPQQPNEQRDVEVSSLSVAASKMATSCGVILIGCGGAGCAVMSSMSKDIDNAYTIAYDTSNRSMSACNADAKVCPEGTDGAGKLREYSKEVFRQEVVFNTILDHVKAGASGREIEYIFIFTSCDGGTGSGMTPALAKMLRGMFNFKVIVIGIYPSTEDDAMCQYNTMEWQADIEKVGVPYMIFDNNAVKAPKATVYQTVNDEIGNAVKLICGSLYSNDAISIVDNRDKHQLVETIGHRITASYSTERIPSNITLDNFLMDMIAKGSCVTPDRLKGAYVFIKGPKLTIDGLDTSMPLIKETFGDTILCKPHIEYSEHFAIGLMTAGNRIPDARLKAMKNRYDDIQSMTNHQEESVNILGDTKNPLLSGKQKTNAADFNPMSAFDDI